MKIQNLEAQNTLKGSNVLGEKNRPFKGKVDETSAS